MQASPSGIDGGGRMREAARGRKGHTPRLPSRSCALLSLKHAAIAVCLALLSVATADRASALVFEMSFFDESDALVGEGLTTTVTGKIVNRIAELSPLTLEAETFRFDTPVDGTTLLVYDPVSVDFRFTGRNPALSNSVAVPGRCGVGECTLEFFPTPDDASVLGSFLAFDAVSDDPFLRGTYEINPDPISTDVPLPGALVLALTGVCGMALLARRRRTTAVSDEVQT